MARVLLPTRQVARKPTFGNPRVNYASPQSVSLRGWWVYTGDIATIRDFSGRGNHMLAGSVAITDELDPVAGLGATFAGDLDSRFDAAIGADVLGTDFPITAAVWLAPDSNGNAFFWGDSGDPGGLHELTAWTDQTRARFNGNLMTDAGANPAGELVHLAYVISSATSRILYKNGVQIAEETDSTAWPSTLNRVSWGSFGDSTPSQAYNGDVYDSRLWKRAFTPAEVWGLFAPETRWDLYLQAQTWLSIDTSGINTENRRRSAGALWWDQIRPVADSSVDEPDRANCAWQYVGLDYSLAVARKPGRLSLLGAGHGEQR